MYYVMSRANGTGNIFESDVDRRDFVKTLAETCEKAGFEVHAYCLMRNHFHLVVETPNGNLVAGMRWLLSFNYPQLWKPARSRIEYRSTATGLSTSPCGESPALAIQGVKP